MEDKQILLQLLQQVCTEEAQLLEEMGLEPNFRNAMLLAQVKKAAKGDSTALRYLRELCQQTPEPGDPSELSALTDRELLAMLEDGDE